jgi:capsular polysaccharide transport system permease protein
MTPSKSSTSAAARAQAIRRARARQLARNFVLWVGVPTLAAILYYGLWAADQYESVVSFRIQATDARALQLDEPGVVPATVAAPPADAELIREMIRSRTMLERLAKEHGLIEHYQQADADWWSRLDADAGYEEAFHYYFDKVEVSHPSKAGALTLKIRAFSAEQAQAFARAIPAIAEEMLNAVVTRDNAERVALAGQLAQARAARVERARQALARLEQAGEARESEAHATARAEVEETQRAYDAALDSVALTRLDSQRKARHVVIVAGPSLPDQATYPKRLWGIATVFVVSLAAMGIISLLAGAVREHAKF